MNYTFIAIEGNIGAGKTTLAQQLADHYKAQLILEEFSENPFLPLFYQDKERYALPLELSFLADRYEQLKRFLGSHDDQCPVIADYSLGKSQLFAKNNLSAIEYDLFLKMASILKTALPKPDLLIYLHAPVAKLQQQIRKRGRPYEQNIEDAYLEQIQQAYRQYLEGEEGNILIIPTDVADLVQQDHFNQLVQFLEAGAITGKKEWTPS